MRDWLPFVAIVACASAAQATTIHVPGDQPTIQAGVDAAANGDTVLVAPGVYSDVTHLPGGVDTTLCAVVMKSNITLRGSGPGQTTIDCDSLGRGIHCGGVTNARIEGFTIREGWAEQYGCGVYCVGGASPRIKNLAIAGNYDGGFIIRINSSPVIEDCTVTGNVGKQGGGAEIDDTCSPTFRSCTFTGNSAPTSGGGVFIRNNSAPLFEDCTFADNFTSSPFGFGGGICVINGRPDFRFSQIQENTSDGGGAGIAIVDSSDVRMTGCAVRTNVTNGTAGGGGGIYCNGANMTLIGCLIADNRVDGAFGEGGGIYGYLLGLSGTSLLHQCTIAGNELASGADGGGIYLTFALVTIEKSIIAYNERYGLRCGVNGLPTVSCCDLFGNTVSNAVCGTDAGGNFSQDPLFCNLAGDDYRIQSTSPCAPGNHPGGALTCQGSRIGSEPVGCGVVDVPHAGDGPSLRAIGRPNPFSTGTMIEIEIASATRVTGEIFDAQGRLVRRLDTGLLPAGSHRLAWDARNESGGLVQPGVYFYRVSGDGARVAGRLVRVR